MSRIVLVIAQGEPDFRSAFQHGANSLNRLEMALLGCLVEKRREKGILCEGDEVIVGKYERRCDFAIICIDVAIEVGWVIGVDGCPQACEEHLLQRMIRER